MVNKDPTKYDTDKSIFNYHIQFTTFCPMGCKGCYQEKLAEKNFIDVDQLIINLQNNFEKYDPQKIKLTLFGGEPLLAYNEIITLMEHIISVRQFLKGKPYLPKDLYNKFRHYQKIQTIYMPTSGGQNNIYLINHLPKILKILPKDIEFKVSISFDGIDNKELRNVPVETIIKGYKLLEDYSNEYGRDIISDNISTVIPQNLTEDYFIDNYEYFIKELNKRVSFTFPHVLDKDSDLMARPEIFQKAIKKFLDKYFGNTKWNETIPKLFEDVLSKIKYKHKFNWCGAGDNHIALMTDGTVKSCDYIDRDGPELLNIMDKYCSNCEIKEWCQRPCLKNIEYLDKGIDMFFLGQCQLRKILFNEIRNQILKKGKLK